MNIQHFKNIRSTICYRLSSLLGYFAFAFLCTNLLLAPIIIKLELAAIVLVVVYLVGILIYIITFILLGIGQFIEQKRIKQFSTNVFFDIGYIIGLIFFVLMFIFLAFIILQG